MKTWTRAKLTRACGKCGVLIEKGEPLLELTLTAATKVRCQACEGPAPPDLPDLVERRVLTSSGMAPIQSLAKMLPLDWKARSAGDREPGEDD